jgi:diketogulonate reductase-like aldo/keto reductase
MPGIGLGTWKLTENTAGIVTEALEMGYRLIDTSGDYGTQPGVGEGIRRSNANRKDLYLTTKVEETDDAYEAAVHNLDELGLGYADLMLIHRPPRYGAGEDLWEGLMRAKDEGLTRDIGVSNYSIEQMQTLMDKFDEAPAVNQIEWSPFGYSKEMLAFCHKNDIIIQAYSPLTRGTQMEGQDIENIAAAHDKTPAQVMLRWAVQMGVVPIPKANHVDHLAENLDIFDFELSREDMDKLNALNRDYSALGRKPVYQQQ